MKLYSYNINQFILNCFYLMLFILTKKLMRANSVSEFRKVYMHAVRISTSLHGDGFLFTKPQVVGRQIHRNNFQASSVEDYYRISLYTKFVSHVINEMNRFLSNENHSVGLLDLLPSHICKTISNFDMPNNLLSAVDFYDLPFSALSMGCGLENGRGAPQKFLTK